MNINAFKTTIFSAAIMLTAMLGTTPAFGQQVTKSWTNADTTWPPEATQEWSIGSNWSGSTVPADLDYVALRRWTGSENVAAFILLDTGTNIAATIRSGHGAKLYIASAGNLRVDGTNTGGDGRVAIGALGGTGDHVSIAPGGQISWVDPEGGSTLTHGYVGLSNNATLDTAGTIKAPQHFNITSGSTMNITGGIIEAHRTYESIRVDGSLNQSGGVIQNTPQLNLATGTYTINGGSITADGPNGLAFRYATTTDGGTIHVDGSGATNISFNGVRYFLADDVNNSEWKFTLDNGANHITPINFTVNGTSGGSLRNGSMLTVDLQGGVLLSGTNTFTLITRPTGTYTDTWGTGPGALWTHDAVNDGVNKIRVTLDATAGKGNLDGLIDKNRIELGGSTHGYVTLSNVGPTLEIGLDFGDGYDSDDLALFKSGLTDAGIDWTTGYGRYEVGLFLDPSVAGGSYFAWDLSGYGTLQLHGIANVIPEPSSLALLGLAGLALRRRRG